MKDYTSTSHAKHAKAEDSTLLAPRKSYEKALYLVKLHYNYENSFTFKTIFFYISS